MLPCPQAPHKRLLSLHLTHRFQNMTAPRIARIHLDKTAFWSLSQKYIPDTQFKQLNLQEAACWNTQHSLLWVTQQRLNLSKLLPVGELSPPPSLRRHTQFVHHHELLHWGWSIVTSPLEDSSPFLRSALPNRLTHTKQICHTACLQISLQRHFQAFPDFWGNKNRLQTHHFTALNGLIWAF